MKEQASGTFETGTEATPVTWQTALKRKVQGKLRGLMLRVSDGLLKAGFDTQARWVLTRIEPMLISNRLTRRLLNTAFAARPSSGNISAIRLADLANRVKRPIARKDYPRLLMLAAEFEALGKPMPLAIGDLLARQIISEPGRARLGAAAKTALQGAPHSPFLLYLHTVILAKEGAYQEASGIIKTAIETLAARSYRTAAEVQQAQRIFENLQNNWRVIDHISREDMGWTDAEGSAGYVELASIGKTRTAARNLAAWTVNFKEPLLQSRDEARYLEACLQDFRAAKRLLDKIRAVSDMLRQSSRRQFTYHRAYAQAGACMDELIPELAALTEGVDAGTLSESAAVNIVRSLINALDVLHTLGRAEAIEALRWQLFQFAQAGLADSALWLVLPELVDENARDNDWGRRSRVLRLRLPEVPRKEHHLKAFLKWALAMRAFAEADRVFGKLPASLRISMSALFYANILQRQSRFTEALVVLRNAHANALSRPVQLNPFQHWNMLRREGELNFLRQTATAFARVPQPRNPKGVVVIAARNLDQLRKYPLVVLMDLRRQGWAVVSLVEGLLPKDKTGDAAIDLLNGCITIERGLTPQARRVFPELEGFVAAPQEGRIEWMGLNLQHSLMEDARINRRAYDVDFSCPALTDSLQKLCDWTRLVAQATVYAQRTFAQRKVRGGLMSLFNSRLPDSLFRLYCEKAGDPYAFFALQVANGYENYFSNFGNKISTRCVVRNVTQFSEVRSASFPRPSVFAGYVEVNRHRVDSVLERVEKIATAKRTTGPDGPTDPAAIACEAQIMEWRAKGGKVACLFGRVVCDSAVPFDGGPAHKDLREWLQSSIDAVRGSNTLLLIKPHPQEINNQIATFLNQYFADLVDGDLPPNVIMMGHRWFTITDLKRFVDLGLVYNGTVAVEMALLDIPCVQANHFGPIDYPLGHPIPESPEQYRAMLRFETPAVTAPDMRARAALWLDYMSNGRFALDYRYHSRPVTNKVVYPPYWIKEELDAYLRHGDPHVRTLARRITGVASEPLG